MAREEKAVFTNMCMVYDNDGNILVQNRKNPNWPGVTFPGGHVEAGESFVASTIREVLEETGLTIESPRLCGIKQFQTGTARYVVLLFKTNVFSGELISSNEGDVFWVKRSELSNYPLANQFEKMMEVFDRDDLSEFYYYDTDDGDWNIQLL